MKNFEENKELLTKISQFDYEEGKPFPEELAKLMERLVVLNDGYIRVVSNSLNKRVKKIEYDDVYQECRFGMMEAALKCDLDKIEAFMSYSSFYMLRRVQKADTLANLIHIPHNIYHVMKKIGAVDSDTSYVPTKERIKSIAKELDMSEAEVEKYMELRYFFAEPNCGDDYILAEDVESEINDVVADYDIEEDVIKRNQLEEIKRIFDEANLSKREKDIIKLRYGLSRDQGLTCDTVGRMYHVTRNRINQIELRALRKLRKYMMQMCA